MGRITIGDDLLQRLREAGIAHLIGVPGDFNLAFLEQTLAIPGIEWVGTCNELNAAYAADGYARMKGAAALLVTYGVGDLSALNCIAGAHAEHVPVICISGVPPLRAIRNREVLHHTVGTGGFEDVMTCMAQFTAAQARITPANAAIEIDRLVRTALREKQPVNLQLPSDISYLEIEAPTAPIGARSYCGDVQQIAVVVERVAGRLLRALRPALLVDAVTHRFGLRPLICGLGERAGLPFASMSSGRSIFNEQHPLYRGIYGGQASSVETLETIESSDCLIAVGVRFFDATTGYFSHRIPTKETILLDAFSATIDGNIYEGVTAEEILAGLIERLPERKAASELLVRESEPASPPYCEERSQEGAREVRLDTEDDGEQRLTQARLWPRLARFLREGDIILAESGTSLSGISGIRLPAGTTFISQITWGPSATPCPLCWGRCWPSPLGAICFSSVTAPSR
jgi:indolepyruvate decarboxylase